MNDTRKNDPSLTSAEDSAKRLADAFERIADALERWADFKYPSKKGDGHE